MSNGVPNWLLSFANKVAKCKFFKQVLKPVYYRYKDYAYKKQTKYFQDNALSVISYFHEVMEANGIEYTLAFGSMLGAVREKGFIKHDIDIDTTIWYDKADDVRKSLIMAGFKLIHEFTIDDAKKGHEETYEYNSVTVDVFYIYPAINQYPYCCDFLMHEGAATFRDSMDKYKSVIARRIEMPFCKDRVLTKFENIQLYIPVNAHELLLFRYGESYMIPNPSWGIRSHDNHIIVWEGVEGIYYGE